MASFPPVIGDSLGAGRSAGVFSWQTDPTKYVVQRRRFERPTLGIIGGDEFEWPLGVEGITISGSASVAEHLYIGDNAAVLQVMHLDNRRIVLTGMFPGLTGSSNVRDLLEILVAPTIDDGKILTLPSTIFPKQQVVVPETWDFSHPEDTTDDSWTYTVTFRRVGVQQKVAPAKVSTPVVAGKTAKPRGKTTRVFTVHAGANTLRAVAQLVFRNPNRWDEIYNKNKTALSKLGVPLIQISTKRLPAGMKLHY